MENLKSLLPDWDFLLSYEGRINRRDYWLKGQLFFFLISFLLQILNLSTLAIIFFILSLYSFSVISIKRAHDLNLSGYFVLLSLIPLVNLWVFIKLGFFKGTSQANAYGPSLLAEKKTPYDYI